MAEQASLGMSSLDPDVGLTLVHPALSLLARQPVLLAVTLHVTAPDASFDITVSKAVDEADQTLPQFWWEVDRLISDTEGQPRRERRWGLGRRAYETPEAAYLAAVYWVEHHQVVPPTGTDNTMQ